MSVVRSPDNGRYDNPWCGMDGWWYYWDDMDEIHGPFPSAVVASREFLIARDWDIMPWEARLMVYVDRVIFGGVRWWLWLLVSFVLAYGLKALLSS